MSLLFMDSFDHYVTADIGDKYIQKIGAPIISSSAGRRSSGCLRANGAASYGVQTRSFSVSGSVAIVGVALKPDRFSDRNGLISIRTGGTGQVTLCMTTGGQLAVYRGPDPWSGSATLLGTTSVSISTSVFTYVEFKVTLHASAGTVDVRFDGVSALSLTGQNTVNSGTAWDSIYLIAGGTAATFTCDCDDLYILDGSGSSPWNDFLGDCRVDARVPTGAGTTTQFTPSTGSNWQNVDDSAPDDDSTYNSTSTVNHIDTFVTQDAPIAGATIYGVQHCISAKKSDAGTCQIAPVVRHSGTNYVGSNVSPSTDYTYDLQAQQTNPGTSAQWTESDFNAAEFGYKRTA